MQNFGVMTTTSISGTPMKVLTATPNMVSSWGYHNNSRTPSSSNTGGSSGGTLVIQYHDSSTGETKELRSGSGEPTYYVPGVQENLKSAQELTAGASGSSKKKLKGMDIDMAATTALMGLTSQCRIKTQGFGSVEDQEWSIAKMTLEQGFSIKIELD